MGEKADAAKSASDVDVTVSGEEGTAAESPDLFNFGSKKVGNFFGFGSKATKEPPQEVVENSKKEEEAEKPQVKEEQGEEAENLDMAPGQVKVAVPGVGGEPKSTPKVEQEQQQEPVVVVVGPVTEQPDTGLEQ